MINMVEKMCMVGKEKKAPLGKPKRRWEIILTLRLLMSYIYIWSTYS